LGELAQGVSLTEPLEPPVELVIAAAVDDEVLVDEVVLTVEVLVEEEALLVEDVFVLEEAFVLELVFLEEVDAAAVPGTPISDQFRGRSMVHDNKTYIASSSRWSIGKRSRICVKWP